MAVSIKSQKEIELMRESCRLLSIVHDEMGKAIKPGISTYEINKIGEDMIKSFGCIPNFKNYNGFPAAICVSVNEEVVHGIPSKKILKEGDIVSLDAGLIYKGYHSDSAWTYPVGKINKEKEYLLYHTEKSLFVGLKELKAGVPLGNASSRIGQYAKKHGLGVVHELVGHGVGHELHEDPDVPNYGVYNTGVKLKEGMVIAVEPMLTAGKRYVVMLDDDWTIVTEDGRPSAHFEHTVAIRKDGYEILTGE